MAADARDRQRDRERHRDSGSTLTYEEWRKEERRIGYETTCLHAAAHAAAIAVAYVNQKKVHPRVRGLMIRVITKNHQRRYDRAATMIALFDRKMKHERAVRARPRPLLKCHKPRGARTLRRPRTQARKVAASSTGDPDPEPDSPSDARARLRSVAPLLEAASLQHHFLLGRPNATRDALSEELPVSTIAVFNSGGSL